MIEGCRIAKLDSLREVSVSEESITKFCGSCERLGKGNICNGFPGGYEWQPVIAYVDAGSCIWAKVDGKLGKLTKRNFTENNWLTPILSQMEKDITPEINNFVNSITPEKILESKRIIEKEFENRQKLYEEHGDDANNLIIYDFLNNWRANLPTSPIDHGASYRDRFGHEKLDIIFGSEGAYGPIKQKQTRREFFTTIDACILKEDLSIEEIIRMNASHQEFSDVVRINTYTLPVFTRLTALGYTWHDLAS